MIFIRTDNHGRPDGRMAGRPDGRSPNYYPPQKIFFLVGDNNTPDFFFLSNWLNSLLLYIVNKWTLFCKKQGYTGNNNNIVVESGSGINWSKEPGFR